MTVDEARAEMARLAARVNAVTGPPISGEVLVEAIRVIARDELAAVTDRDGVAWHLGRAGGVPPGVRV